VEGAAEPRPHWALGPRRPAAALRTAGGQPQVGTVSE
jgi:hypothetical protein